jgi:protein TonB
MNELGTTKANKKSLGISSLSTLKKYHARLHRSQLLAAVAVSSVLHIALFAFSAHKSAKVEAVAAPKALAEKFIIPVDDTPEPVEEVTEIQDASPAMSEFAPPMQNELMSVPIDSDFVMAPAPRVETNTKVDANLLQIPTHIGRGGGVSKLEGVFNLADLDRTPVIVTQRNPDYPIELRNTNMAGTVVVRFIVNSIGAVTNIEVVSSPHPAFTRAVVRSLDKWKFKPGMKGGKAVSTVMELPVGFSMAAD